MEQELTEAFRRLKKRDVDTFPAVVVSVDKEQGTCVISADGLELPDVQLSAIIDGRIKNCICFQRLEARSWYLQLMKICTACMLSNIPK